MKFELNIPEVLLEGNKTDLEKIINACAKIDCSKCDLNNFNSCYDLIWFLNKKNQKDKKEQQPLIKLPTSVTMIREASDITRFFKRV